MSHFSTAVFTDGSSTVDELLAPYQEDCGFCDTPMEYLKFYDMKEECEPDYNNGNSVLVELSDGSLVSMWHNKFRKEIDEIFESCSNDDGVDTIYLCPIVILNHTQRYSDLDLFMTKYNGYKYYPEMDGYGYWQNPNAKWDWYIEGGRWDGVLKTKTGERVSSGIMRDLDFSQEQDKYNDAIRYWEIVVEKSEPTEEEKEKFMPGFYNADYYLERYGSKERYASEVSNFSTYAVVTPDGEWYGKGDMGWWGIGSETHEESKNWHNTYAEKFITPADPDWTMTIVDCHI